MKIKLTKTFSCVFDTDDERKRIKDNFEGETRRKLEEFMCAIEAFDFDKAKELLENKWWTGRDEERGCLRLEFIGPLFTSKSDPEGFDMKSSYEELVYSKFFNPSNYSCKRIS